MAIELSGLARIPSAVSPQRNEQEGAGDLLKVILI
jgi:hypothetical protein